MPPQQLFLFVSMVPSSDPVARPVLPQFLTSPARNPEHLNPPSHHSEVKINCLPEAFQRAQQVSP